MKRNSMAKSASTRPSGTMARFALLTLGAKKATELWRSRRQPPPTPSVAQRLAAPARGALVVGAVGGVAYLATKKGMVTQIKQKLGLEGRDETVAFTGSGVDTQAPPPIQPTEPSSVIVDTHSTSEVAPEPPSSTV